MVISFIELIKTKSNQSKVMDYIYNRMCHEVKSCIIDDYVEDGLPPPSDYVILIGLLGNMDRIRKATKKMYADYSKNGRLHELENKETEHLYRVYLFPEST